MKKAILINGLVLNILQMLFCGFICICMFMVVGVSLLCTNEVDSDIGGFFVLSMVVTVLNWIFGAFHVVLYTTKLKKKKGLYIGNHLVMAFFNLALAIALCAGYVYVYGTPANDVNGAYSNGNELYVFGMIVNVLQAIAQIVMTFIVNQKKYWVEAAK